MGFSSADIAREREAIWMAKSLKDASAPTRRRFYRKDQKLRGDLMKALATGDEEKIKNAREKLQDLYFDLYEYNAEAREEGESYREIKLNRATIKQNVQNELYGVNSTLSDLPSQTRPTATKLLKEIVPRGVD